MPCRSGRLGAIAGGLMARRLMDRTFSFRHRRIATDLARHRDIGQRAGGYASS